MAEQFYSITTHAGDRAIAAALQSGKAKTLKYLAVGDSGGAYYEPDKGQTALRGEKWRGLAAVSADMGNPKRVIVTASIPSAVGGFSIREAGVFDEEGTLMAVSKQPLSDKVLPDSGAAKDVSIRIYLEVTDAGAVTITVDPSAQFVSHAEFFGHTEDRSLHTTQEEKEGFAAHLADQEQHLMPGDRERWDSKYGGAAAQELILSAAGWASTAPYLQTVQAAGMTAKNHKIVGIKADAPLDLRELYAACGVHASAELEGALVFTADYERPAQDLPVSILIVG